MSDKGIAFRDTAGFVTDPANVTYCLAETYPTVRGGSTFGWSSSITGQSRDRDNTLGNLAGINYIPSATTYFQLDLPAAVSTDIHAGFGDPTGNSSDFIIKDNATAIVTISKTYDGTFSDATNANFANAAAWVAGETAKTYTMASTALRVTANNAGQNNVIAFLRAVQSAAAGAFNPYFYRHIAGMGGMSGAS
jgi:hypothetical protein